MSDDQRPAERAMSRKSAATFTLDAAKRRLKATPIANAERLQFLAALVAVEAPLLKNKWANEARVRWSLINKIRSELDAIGFDWEAVITETKKEHSA